MRQSYRRTFCKNEPILRARTTGTQRAYLLLTARVIQGERTVRQRNAVYALGAKVYGDNRTHSRNCTGVCTKGCRVPSGKDKRTKNATDRPLLQRCGTNMLTRSRQKRNGIASLLFFKRWILLIFALFFE